MVALPRWWHCHVGGAATLVALPSWRRCQVGGAAKLVALPSWWRCQVGGAAKLVALPSWRRCQVVSPPSLQIPLALPPPPVIAHKPTSPRLQCSPAHHHVNSPPRHSPPRHCRRRVMCSSSTRERRPSCDVATSVAHGARALHYTTSAIRLLPRLRRDCNSAVPRFIDTEPGHSQASQLSHSGSQCRRGPAR